MRRMKLLGISPPVYKCSKQDIIAIITTILFSRRHIMRRPNHFAFTGLRIITVGPTALNTFSIQASRGQVTVSNLNLYRIVSHHSITYTTRQSSRCIQSQAAIPWRSDSVTDGFCII